MAEEFQAEVCGESWWSSPRATSLNGSSFIGGGCWQNDFMNVVKTSSRSTDESSGGNNYATTISPDSAAFQIITSSSSPAAAAAAASTIMASTRNQANLLVNIGRNEESDYNQTLPEILNNLPGGQNSLNFGMEQDQHTSTNFITTSSGGNFTSCGLLQTLFDTTSPPAAAPVYDFEATNLNEFDPAAGFSNRMLKPKVQAHNNNNNNLAGGGLRLANKTPFWNAAAAAASALDLNDNRAAAAAAAAGFFASTQARFLPPSTNIKSQNEQIRDLRSSVKKSSSEPTFKRPRLETPSPLPTFKVRKEKLGDRVTALQQLVSPFGKTDTASVLHEAIEYIKHLHDQVNVLSTPYMKNGATTQMQQIHNKVKDNTEGGGAAKQQDLRSRGLCLVPVSVTFPVANETAPDYWPSSFGSTFK